MKKVDLPGCQTVFSVQDINQISLKSNELFLESVLGTINSFIIHAGSVQSTAQKLSSVQSYNIDWAILELQKPYKSIKPTALFISKYPVLKGKKRNQTVARIFPYVYRGEGESKNISIMERLKLQIQEAIELDKKEEKKEKENSLVSSQVIKEAPEEVRDRENTEELQKFDINNLI